MSVGSCVCVNENHRCKHRIYLKDSPLSLFVWVFLHPFVVLFRELTDVFLLVEALRHEEEALLTHCLWAFSVSHRELCCAFPPPPFLTILSWWFLKRWGFYAYWLAGIKDLERETGSCIFAHTDKAPQINFLRFDLEKNTQIRAAFMHQNLLPVHLPQGRPVA